MDDIRVLLAGKGTGPEAAPSLAAAGGTTEEETPGEYCCLHIPGTSQPETYNNHQARRWGDNLHDLGLATLITEKHKNNVTIRSPNNLGESIVGENITEYFKEK